MARLIELRDTAYLTGALASIKQAEQASSLPFPARFREQHRADFKTDRLLTSDQACLERALSVETSMQHAALASAAGADAAQVRGIYRAAAEAWLPIIQELDFEPRQFEDHGWGTPSQARERTERFDGEVVERKGQYVRCRWMARPQPFRIEAQKAFECAALSGDRELARRLASGYTLLEPQQCTKQYEIREAILRHLLAEDDIRARQLAGLLADGYPNDWPPQRIEFPQGVIEADGQKLVAGLDATNKRFDTMWDEAKHRKKHANILAKPSRLSGSQPTWDEFLDQVRGELVGLRWTMSTWALAFLNIASWRGMSAPFDQPELFSRWVPLKLARL